MGAVKTRLARDIGPVAATAFYRTATANLIRRLGEDPRWDLRLGVGPAAAVRSRFWPAQVTRLAQGKGDLGRRMWRLLHSQLPGPAILIGSDIPGVRPAHIAEAFRVLDRNDVVFGPADDGGFWLIGIKPLPRLRDPFGKVRWSSPNTLSDTLDALSGYRVGFAAQLGDVDDATSFGVFAPLGRRVAVGPLNHPRGSPARSGS